MHILTRRSLLRGSLAFGATRKLAKPRIANAAATTAEVWWQQGFGKEEDPAFKKMAADYEKASGNKINSSIIPFAALGRKAISAVTSDVVPDIIEVYDNEFAPLTSWDDKLVDVGDIVAAQKADFVSVAVDACFLYNNTTKERGYYMVPMKINAVPFHVWRSLVEKAGYKVSDIPNTWDGFLDFFKPVQDKLRAQGMRNIYAYGYQLTANGNDPVRTFNAFLIAHGGKDFVTPDGGLHANDPQVRAAAVKAIEQLTTPFKDGYVPPSCVSWNDSDDNNAFHSKLMVMDFDGSISTEIAVYDKKELYDDILTLGLPLGNDGKPLPNQLSLVGPVIPKGAKNVEVAKEFIKYAVQPKVLNEYLKGGLGRWMIPMPEIAKSDPFWFKDDPHRTAYAEQTLLAPIMPMYEVFNPAIAEVNSEHLFSVAEFDVIKGGMTPEAAVDKAFNRIKTIFEKYPIQQS